MGDHSRYLTGELGKLTRPKVIEFRQLTASQEGQATVHNFTLDIFAGEVVAVSGPPDSGKRTLLACLQGQLQPLHGEVRVFGLPLPPLTAEVRRQMGVFPRELVPRPVEAVGDYLQRFASYYDISLSYVQCRAYCASYQLSAAAAVAGLNRVQSRICALALALIHDPHLVLLDDPLDNLSAEEQAAFWPYLQRMRSEGRTVFCTVTPPLAENYLNGYDLIIPIVQGERVHEKTDGGQTCRAK